MMMIMMMPPSPSVIPAASINDLIELIFKKYSSEATNILIPDI